MSTDRPRRPGVPTRLAACGVAVTALATVAACGGESNAGTTPAATTGTATTSASAVPTSPVLARVGDLQVAAGYVPAPASATVGAAYLTVVNGGSAADTLVSATSDASRTTSMHRTEGGAMVAISDFAIPAGGAAAVTPGAAHRMLDALTPPLAQGARVRRTLHIATAGTVVVTLPVTGYPTDGGLPSAALSPLPSTTVAP